MASLKISDFAHNNSLGSSPVQTAKLGKVFRNENLFCPKKAFKIVVLFSLRLCNP